MKNKIITSALTLALATAGIFTASSAFAGTVNNTMSATASVANSCKIASVTGISFGAYDPASANATTALTANGSVSVNCTKGGAVSVALDQGANAASGSTCVAPTRQMKNSSTSDMLGYQVYSDSALTKKWACDATNEVSFTSTSALTPVVETTYGSVAGGQDVPAGSYADTVTVTVSF